MTNLDTTYGALITAPAQDVLVIDATGDELFVGYLRSDKVTIETTVSRS